MKELLDKITSYNLFNHLFPGVVFVSALYATGLTKFVTDHPILGAFICYFIGMIISRIGSIIVEPVLKKFVTWSDYSDYVEASKIDTKIDILLEGNNTYRTVISGLILYGITLVALYFNDEYKLVEQYPLSARLGLVIILTILFFVSYKKQTDYIVKRINKVCSKE